MTGQKLTYRIGLDLWRPHFTSEIRINRENKRLDNETSMKGHIVDIDRLRGIVDCCFTRFRIAYSHVENISNKVLVQNTYQWESS